MYGARPDLAPALDHGVFRSITVDPGGLAAIRGVLLEAAKPEFSVPPLRDTTDRRPPTSRRTEPSTPPPRRVGLFPSSRAPAWRITGIVLPVKTTIDRLGRIVVPKALRDALGLTPGSTVDVSRYGAGLQLIPAGRTARLVEVDGALVADSSTPVTDDDVFGLLDSGRR